MRTLGFEEALAAYEGVRRRLPQMPPVSAPSRMAGNLGDLADAFDVFLLDGFGVLNVGDAAIPGAIERVAALRAMGRTVLVLTNAASEPPPGLAEKYARLGFSFGPDEIVSSRSVALDAVAAMLGQRWGVMLPEAAALDDLPPGHEAALLADDPEPYRAAGGFLLLGSGSWTEHRQGLLEAALRASPRPVIVGNPDIVAPRRAGLTAEPGWFAHRLSDSTGIAPVFCGKPFGPIFEAARARIGGHWPRGRVLMVGDSLHTDILGARVAGIASALVTDHGFLAARPHEQIVQATGIVPDFVVGTT
ncbi:HAD family hydrolase [Paralimibaculum aggregatum]|uniref:HAD family hydrolase n=2 Tax=Paralimibaculum aggregatum TaxID=3036245 RepID=A0ABQ6LTJ5_9RHOB|nr:HAD family hydrolase [Limibaculum sp. NKW23]